jgi:hypothetical protein
VADCIKVVSFLDLLPPDQGEIREGEQAADGFSAACREPITSEFSDPLSSFEGAAIQRFNDLVTVFLAQPCTSATTSSMRSTEVDTGPLVRVLLASD